MRTEKLDLLLAGFSAFVVMAAVLVVWGLVRHQPVIEYRHPHGAYLPYTGPGAVAAPATIQRAPKAAPAAPPPAPKAAPAAPDAGP